jgi:hypothetical protein
VYNPRHILGQTMGSQLWYHDAVLFLSPAAIFLKRVSTYGSNL